MSENTLFSTALGRFYEREEALRLFQKDLTELLIKGGWSKARVVLTDETHGKEDHQFYVVAGYNRASDCRDLGFFLRGLFLANPAVIVSGNATDQPVLDVATEGTQP